MGMSSADYLAQLKALLPRGLAWGSGASTYLSMLLGAFAQLFAMDDARAMDLIEEADPRTTYALLPEFEQAFGLSAFSVVDGSALSIEQRRSNLVAKYTGRGGQSRAYFIALAARLGFVVTIEEFSEFSVDADVDAPIYGEEWNFAWQVNAPLSTSTEMTVDSDVDESITTDWLNYLFEASFQEDKPAHTVLIFNYA